MLLSSSLLQCLPCHCQTQLCLCSGHRAGNRAWQGMSLQRDPFWGLLHHQPQRKGEHLQLLGAPCGMERNRPCPLTPINAINLPWVSFNLKSRCAALSLISLSFKPLGVYIFLSPQMEILHKRGPTAGSYTVWYKGTFYQT